MCSVEITTDAFCLTKCHLSILIHPWRDKRKWRIISQVFSFGKLSHNKVRFVTDMKEYVTCLKPDRRAFVPQVPKSSLAVDWFSNSRFLYFPFPFVTNRSLLTGQNKEYTNEGVKSFASIFLLLSLFLISRGETMQEPFIFGAFWSIFHPIRLTSFYYGQCVFACVHEDMWVTFPSPSVGYAYISRRRRRRGVCVCECVAIFLYYTVPTIGKMLSQLYRQMEVKKERASG